MTLLQITEKEVFPDWVKESPFSHIRNIARPKRVAVEPVDPDYVAFHPERLMEWYEWEDYKPRRLTFEQIKRETCLKYRVSKRRFEGTTRDASSVLCRQEAWHRGRYEAGVSTPFMAERSGNRDHSTVIHGIQRYAAHLQMNESGQPK